MYWLKLYLKSLLICFTQKHEHSRPKLFKHQIDSFLLSDVGIMNHKVLASAFALWAFVTCIPYVEISDATLLALLFIHYYCAAGNKLNKIPDSMCEMQSLRTLDVSMNQLTELPQYLCKVRTLDSLILDASLMNNPPEGTQLL